MAEKEKNERVSGDNTWMRRTKGSRASERRTGGGGMSGGSEGYMKNCGCVFQMGNMLGSVRGCG